MNNSTQLGLASPYKKWVIVLWWLALGVTTAFSLHPKMGPPTTPLFEIGLDKFIHFGTYLVLSALPALLFSPGKATNLSVLLVAALSICIEFAQDLVPGRLFSTGDVLANMTGVVSGVGIGLYLRWLRLRYFR